MKFIETMKINTKTSQLKSIEMTRDKPRGRVLHACV